MSLRCTECGAAPREPAQRFCTYCGAALPQPAPPPAARAAERADVARRFARLSSDPRAQAALRERPSGAGAVAGHGVLTLFTLLFVAVAGFAACTILGTASSVERGFDASPGDAPNALFGVMRLVPLVVVGAGIFAAIRALTKTTRVATAPVRAHLAHVLEEHAEVRGANDRSYTAHVVTLESEAGDRSSFEIQRSLARSLTRGDMGVAHTKGGELIRFTRVDV